jgi:hypothetical protein
LIIGRVLTGLGSFRLLRHRATPGPLPESRYLATSGLADLLAQKDFPQLLMLTEPKFGLGGRAERPCKSFLRDHLGSLECRVRNDHAKCSGTDERDSDGNDRSDRELRNAATHVDSPSW